jgi:hypothetical protein
MGAATVQRRITRPTREQAIDAALEAGWTLDQTAKNHPRLTPPRGRRDGQGDRLTPVTFARTPSDWRGDRNAIAKLRRSGIEI